MCLGPGHSVFRLYTCSVKLGTNHQYADLVKEPSEGKGVLSAQGFAVERTGLQSEVW